jgi:alkyl sulfatase BDS1-like metallo-beta-lactamase superfamily hydrolase
VPRGERAERLVRMMGGRDAVLRAVEEAYETGEYQWAAELATHLIQVDRDDMAARNLKAAAFRRLGYTQMNINWRNWYLTSAMELDGSLDMNQAQKMPGQKFASPDIIKALPAGIIFEGMTTKLAAEKTLDMHVAMGFCFSDSNESYALEIRRGIVEFHPVMPESVDLMLTLPRRFLNDHLLTGETVTTGIESGEIDPRGELPDIQAFFNCFDMEPHPIWLTLR